MVTTKLQELAAMRAKVAALEESIRSELAQELASLPAQYGFESVAAFVKAVQAASGKRRGRKPGKQTLLATGWKKRRKRAVVTDETRASVKKMVGEAKTGSEIAAALGISLPTVAKIKKALGLTRKKTKT